MAFMERQVEKGEWLVIDGPAGGESIPAYLVDLKEVEEIQDQLETEKEVGLAAYKLEMYFENHTVWEMEIVKGYGARMSAPGYTDATDWTVFKTEKEAEEYLDEYYGDEEEDEEEEEMEESKTSFKELNEFVNKKGAVKEQAGNFSKDSNEWFDKVSLSKPFVLDDPALIKLSQIVDMAPSKENFDKFAAALDDVRVPWNKLVKKFVDDMRAGKYKGEFRQFAGPKGQSSQVSELFSLMRQALHYYE